MRSSARKYLDSLYDYIEARFRAYQYTKYAKTRLKKINGGNKCDYEFRKTVVPFWAQYNVKPKKLWYRLFSAETKIVDPRYIPNDIWFSKIVPYYSNMQFRRPYEDKCMHAVLFPDVKRPETIIMNMAGIYFDKNYKIIDKEKAIKLCLENKDSLIKPSVDSGEGRLIEFFDKEDIRYEDINKTFTKLDCNFIVQKIVKQHEVISRFNEHSLNTIRILSFLFNGEVHMLSAILRIGSSGSRVDNIGAGGYACAIDNKGKLHEYGVNKNSDWCKQTKNGIIFKGVEIPSYDKVIKIIKKEHQHLPHFKIIGWDMSIDQDGEPVFIEYNSCPGQNQFSCGPTFGDITEEVLEDVFIKRTLKNSKN